MSILSHAGWKIHPGEQPRRRRERRERREQRRRGRVRREPAAEPLPDALRGHRGRLHARAALLQRALGVLVAAAEGRRERRLQGGWGDFIPDRGSLN